MKMTIVSTNRLIAAMMMMAMPAAMPAMAGNKHHNNRDKKVVAVVDKKKTHFDRVDNKHTAHFDKRHAYHPEMRICTFKLGRHDSPTKMMARAERIYGVKDTKYNPHTREITVLYDANKTTARHIKHAVA